MLPAREAERLASILAMLESPYDGERAAAGLLASRIVRAAGITWRELVAPEPRQSPPPPPPPRQPPPTEWRVMVRQCLDRAEKLSGWECTFLASVSRRRSLSPKQRAVLERIAEKAGI